MTTNPHKAKSLIPIGGYKGYGMSAMIEILCSINIDEFWKKNTSHAYLGYKKTKKFRSIFIIMKSDLHVNNSLASRNLENLYKDIYKLPKLKKVKCIFA